MTLFDDHKWAGEANRLVPLFKEMVFRSRATIEDSATILD